MCLIVFIQFFFFKLKKVVKSWIRASQDYSAFLGIALVCIYSCYPDIFWDQRNTKSQTFLNRVLSKPVSTRSINVPQLVI